MVRKESMFDQGGAGAPAAKEHGVMELIRAAETGRVDGNDGAELELKRRCEEGSLRAFRVSVLAGQGYGQAVRWVAQRLKERSEAMPLLNGAS